MSPANKKGVPRFQLVRKPDSGDAIALNKIENRCAPRYVAAGSPLICVALAASLYASTVPICEKRAQRRFQRGFAALAHTPDQFAPQRIVMQRGTNLVPRSTADVRFRGRALRPLSMNADGNAGWCVVGALVWNLR